MKTKLQTVFPAVLFVLSFITFSTVATSQEQAEVWVYLDVTATHEEYFLAGDPPSRVNYSTEIAFTHYGFYMFNRFKVGNGYQYMAIPGRGGSGRTPQVTGISVIQSHPCMDGQSLVIGKETRNIPADILAGTIGLTVKPADKERLSIQLSPVELDAEMLECSNPDCMNGFGFSYGDNVVGLDRASQTEDEYGYEEVSGYDMVSVDFSLLQEIAAGTGEIPLTIPISVEKIYRNEEDTPTGPVEKIYTFRVNGWIGAPPEGE